MSFRNAFSEAPEPEREGAPSMKDAIPVPTPAPEPECPPAPRRPTANEELLLDIYYDCDDSDRDPDQFVADFLGPPRDDGKPQ